MNEPSQWDNDIGPGAKVDHTFLWGIVVFIGPVAAAFVLSLLLGSDPEPTGEPLACDQPPHFCEEPPRIDTPFDVE